MATLQVALIFTNTIFSLNSAIWVIRKLTHIISVISATCKVAIITQSTIRVNSCNSWAKKQFVGKKEIRCPQKGNSRITIICSSPPLAAARHSPSKLGLCIRLHENWPFGKTFYSPIKNSVSGRIAFSLSRNSLDRPPQQASSRCQNAGLWSKCTVCVSSCSTT